MGITTTTIAPCPKEMCHAPSYTSGGAMSEAGKVMQYNRSSDEMVAACLPAKVNVKCPANNALKHRPADWHRPMD